MPFIPIVTMREDVKLTREDVKFPVRLGPIGRDAYVPLRPG